MLRNLKSALLRCYMQQLAKQHVRQRVPEHVEVIALWQFGGLGDMLLATSAIQTLSLKYPQAKIHVWCSHPHFANFLTRFPQVKTIHAFAIYDFDMRTLLKAKVRKRLRSVLQTMQSYQVDMLVNLHLPKQLDWWAVEWWLLKQLRLRFRIGFIPLFIQKHAFYDAFIHAELGGEKHYTQLYQELLENAGVTSSRQTFFPIEQQEKLRAKAMLKAAGIDENKILACMHIGGRRLKLEHKMWSVESFAALAKKLLADGVQPVLIGVESELGMGENLCQMVPEVVSFIGKTEMGEMVSLISLADVFIGHDSGPFHIAVAHQRSVVVICGRPDAEPEYLKYDKQNVVVCSADLPELITVNDVYQIANELLSASSPPEKKGLTAHE